MKINTLQGEIDNSRSKLEKIQYVLQEGQTQKSDLVSQIDSANREKAALEQRLKELETAASAANQVSEASDVAQLNQPQAKQK